MRLLTIGEVADLLGISKYHTYEMARRGDLKRVLIGRVVRVPEDAVRVFIERGGQPRRASPHER